MTNISGTQSFNANSLYQFQFSSPDWRKVFQSSVALFDSTLAKIAPDERPEAFLGLSAGELSDLYKRLKPVSERTQRLLDVREPLRELSIEQLAALMQLESVRGHLRAGAYVMAERNQQNHHAGSEVFNREDRRARLLEEVNTYRNLGYSADSLRDIYTHKKIWMTYTPHPTKDKNDAGQNAFRALVEIAEKVDPSEREAVMSGLMRDMITTRLTPAKKDTYEDEANDGMHVQAVYNEGMLAYFEDVQYAFDQIYGPGAVNLIDADMHLDVSPRKWHNTDADGKPIPATVLFNQRVADSLMAVKINLETLANPSLDGQPGSDELAHIRDVFRQFEAGLEKLQARAQEFVALGSDSGAFQAAQMEFKNIFRNASYKGQSRFEHGPDLTRLVMNDLRALHAREDISDEMRSAAWRTVFRHMQNGIALGRMELRHNGEDYDRIFENLYRHLREQNIDIVPPQDDVPDLAALPAKSQVVFFKRLMEKYGQQPAKSGQYSNIVEQWLYEANPPVNKPLDDMTPAERQQWWHHEILQRFKMVSRCFNHERMGAAIIAEAKPSSAVKQQVLAEALGMKNMVHVALNEDHKSIREAAQNLSQYSKVFGMWNIFSRKTNGNGHTSNIFLAVMDPQSDSQRGYGLFIRGLQRATKQRLIGLGLSIQAAVYDKIGTGASYARGGFSPKIVPRLFINALTEIKDWKKQDKALLRQMASFVSTTIQGRDAGIRWATPGQVYDNLYGIDSETNAACLVVDEKIRADVIAPAAAIYSSQMKQFLETIQEEQCERYSEVLRGEPSSQKLGKSRINRYLEKVSALLMSEQANVGARPDVRPGTLGSAKKAFGRVAKQVVKFGNKDGLRAIGTNIANENSETLYDGSYTMGFFFQRLHQAYKEGIIDKNDLITLRNDKFFMQQVFSNAMAALASADYGHAYDEMSGTGQSWTAGKVRAAHCEGYKGMDENVVFHTVLANDAILATSYMEALLNDDFDLSENEIIAKVYSNDALLHQLSFGAETRRLYPDIDQLQEYAAEKRLSRAIIHETERRAKLYAQNPQAPGAINIDEKDIASLTRHISAARRNKGPINMNNLLDQEGSAFGARNAPVMTKIREYCERNIHGFGQYSAKNARKTGMQEDLPAPSGI